MRFSLVRRSKAMIWCCLLLLSSITCGTSHPLPGSQRQTQPHEKRCLETWPRESVHSCRSTRWASSLCAPRCPFHGSPAVPALCWGNHPCCCYSRTGANSDLGCTSTRQTHHRSTHILRLATCDLSRAALLFLRNGFCPAWSIFSTVELCFYIGTQWS